MEQNDRSFLGTGWSFPPTFRRELHGVEMLVEEEAVRSSIQIILSTITGERLMLPNYGMNLHPFVFECMNVQIITLIKKIVHDALVLNEPRIIVENVDVSPDQEHGILSIEIAYKVIETNTRYNFVYPFYFDEATNIQP